MELYAHMPLCTHACCPGQPFRALACYSPFNLTHLLPLSYMSGVLLDVMQLCLLSFAMCISGHVTHLYCDSAQSNSRYLYLPPPSNLGCIMSKSESCCRPWLATSPNHLPQLCHAEWENLKPTSNEGSPAEEQQGKNEKAKPEAVQPEL
jgi:hypothetical protein